MRAVLVVDGERHLALETVAEIYHVQTVWLREVYDSGLLGRGHEAGGTISIAVTRLDRVATVVRLRHLCGSDVDTLALALASWPHE